MVARIKCGVKCTVARSIEWIIYYHECYIRFWNEIFYVFCVDIITDSWKWIINATGSTSSPQHSSWNFLFCTQIFCYSSWYIEHWMNNWTETAKHCQQINQLNIYFRIFENFTSVLYLLLFWYPRTHWFFVFWIMSLVIYWNKPFYYSDWTHLVAVFFVWFFINIKLINKHFNCWMLKFDETI